MSQEINKSFTLDKSKKKNPLFIHIILFAATFLTTSIAGVQWAGKDFTDLGNLEYGLIYGLLMITFLTAHEFGHYIASRIHKVEATLPYYIPFPPVPGMVGLFGTFGAVIKTRTPILTRKALFDIGVAGPIAGFIVSLIFLIYGLMTLPGIDFIYNIHPEYLLYLNGEIPKISLHFGDTILYSILSNTIANPDGFLPPMNEIYHYPFLNVGWFGLFVTTLNMIPIGQLDGGHISYAMFGSKIQGKIARVFWWAMMIIGTLALLGVIHDMLSLDYSGGFMQFIKNIFLSPLHWIKINTPWIYAGWAGWLFWGFITKVFIKLDHPPVRENDELDPQRKAIGWIAYLILFLSISYNGIYFVE
ncbi:site-2 protease family protein [Bacteroidota bacterium]